MRQSVLQSASRCKLDNAFTGPWGVSVGVSDVARRSEVILQVLPRSPGRDVFDNNPVVCLGSRRVSSPPSVASSAIESTTSTVTSAVASTVASTVTVPSVTWVAGQLDTDAATLHVLAIQVGDCVLGIPVIVELDETVSVLDDDFPDSSVAFEEPFDVPLPGIAGNISHVHSLARRHLKIYIWLVITSLITVI